MTAHKIDYGPFSYNKIQVIIDRDFLYKGVRVYLSDFAGPDDTPQVLPNDKKYQPIANVGFLIPRDGHNWAVEEVTIRVNVSDENLSIYALKSGGENNPPIWEELTTKFESGYIEAQLKIGDPPIAVG